MAQSAATEGSGGPQLYEGLPPPVHGPAPAAAPADEFGAELVEEPALDEEELDAAAAAAAGPGADPADAESAPVEVADTFDNSNEEGVPPAAPPSAMAMDQRLANRLSQFNTIIVQEMITSLVTNNCLTEEDYLDAASSVDDARKSFTLLAGLKLVTSARAGH